MIFAKVDVGLPRHHRVMRIPKAHRAAALGAWLAALCYAREQELDGFCPADLLEELTAQTVIDRLVEVELLARCEQGGVHGYLVLRYAEKNETKSQIETRRRATADRVAKFRQKRSGNGECNAVHERVTNAFVPGSGSDSGSVSDLSDLQRDPDGSTGREQPSGTVRLVRNATDDGAFGESAPAWCAGIESVTGQRFTLPTRGVQALLVQCFVDQRWQDIVERAREAGAAYASAHRGRTLSPHNYVDWEGSGRPRAGGPAKARELSRQPAAAEPAWKEGK